jgi:hypothetical protein
MSECIPAKCSRSVPSHHRFYHKANVEHRNPILWKCEHRKGLGLNICMCTWWQWRRASTGSNGFEALAPPAKASLNTTSWSTLVSFRSRRQQQQQWGKDSSATRIRRALLQHRTLSRHPHTHTRIGIDTHTRIGKVKSECLYVFSVYTGSGRRRLGERVRSDGQESTDDVASPEARSCFHRP